MTEAPTSVMASEAKKETFKLDVSEAKEELGTESSGATKPTMEELKHLFDLERDWAKLEAMSPEEHKAWNVKVWATEHSPWDNKDRGFYNGEDIAYEEQGELADHYWKDGSAFHEPSASQPAPEAKEETSALDLEQTREELSAMSSGETKAEEKVEEDAHSLEWLFAKLDTMSPEQLEAIDARIWGPGGCPWDKMDRGFYHGEDVAYELQGELADTYWEGGSPFYETSAPQTVPGTKKVEEDVHSMESMWAKVAAMSPEKKEAMRTEIWGPGGCPYPKMKRGCYNHEDVAYELQGDFADTYWEGGSPFYETSASQKASDVEEEVEEDVHSIEYLRAKLRALSPKERKEMNMRIWGTEEPPRNMDSGFYHAEDVAYEQQGRLADEYWTGGSPFYKTPASQQQHDQQEQPNAGPASEQKEQSQSVAPSKDSQPVAER